MAVLVALWLATGFLKAEAAIARLARLTTSLRSTSRRRCRSIGPNRFDKLVIALVALVVGVAGIWALFYAANASSRRSGQGWTERLRPWVFVFPAVAVLGFYLVFPTVGTLIIRASPTARRDGDARQLQVGVHRPRRPASPLRNNVVWLVLGTGRGSVLIGLAFATLVDRVQAGVAGQDVRVPARWPSRSWEPPWSGGSSTTGDPRGSRRSAS